MPHAPYRLELSLGYSFVVLYAHKIADSTSSVPEAHLNYLKIFYIFFFSFFV